MPVSRDARRCRSRLLEVLARRRSRQAGGPTGGRPLPLPVRVAVYPPLGGTDDRAAYFVEVGKGPHEADASPAAQQQPPEDAGGTQADIGVLTALPSVIVATGALGVLVMNRRWRGQLQEVTD
ncbi:hypothetical protein DIPPA_24613 [Diplonema papillatum]|nr:hypothetical protein DIPPA_24613 [Diplonema papillatum]